MNHWLIVPILLPLFTGGLLLTGYRAANHKKRWLAIVCTWALVPLAAYLVWLADDGVLRNYQLGNWQAPFGISLLLDRLSAVMLLVTALLASACVYFAKHEDQQAPNFYGLFQFQLLGINGAFLTADLFNLFVFFEILLIASYALLVYGNHANKVRAGISYVILNLVGSSLFLIGIGILYGLLGTLSLSELSIRISQASSEQASLLAAAGFCLLLVFALKAAVLPLNFWLPHTYSVANASIAALFAIMTKVGLYAIVRVFTLLFGSEANELAHFALPLLWWLALATIALAAIGALAAKNLSVLTSYLVLVSVGTLLAGLSLGTAPALTASLYYLAHSTLATGAMFLLAGLVSKVRGDNGFEVGNAFKQPLLLGALFFFIAIAMAGLPPLSGFIGKVMLLKAASTQSGWVLWPILLIASFMVIVALVRAGSVLFWQKHECQNTVSIGAKEVLPILMLLLPVLILVIAAEPVVNHLNMTSLQLLNLEPYWQVGGVQ